jgi:glycosyltransferase involved in cell wall biosynthesis
LIVVDNNSSDHTRSVCTEFADRLPIRYLFEPRQGKSCALNNAISHAKGELLMLTDDDVDVDPQWLANLLTAANQFPEAVFMGGKCLPRWAQPPPSWLEQHAHGLLSGVSVALDKGEGMRFLVSTETPLLYGANLAIRRNILGSRFRFCEDIGPRGNDGTRQEETILQLELLKAGHRGLYVGAAIVNHRNPQERMTERFIRLWYKGAGIGDVRMGYVDGSPHILFGAPRYLWRILLKRFTRYVTTRVRCDSEVWLRAEMEWARTWGWISEFRRQSRRAGRS